MIISYDGPPNFKNKTVTIKIELHPDEVAPVVACLLNTVPERCINITCGRLDDHNVRECP